MLKHIFRLTETGFEKWERAYQIIFSYIRMIQKLSNSELERILNEIKNIKKAAWTCLEEKPATRNVTEISAKMAIYPSHKWISGGALVQTPPSDEDLMTSSRNYLNEMNPKNCITFLSSQNHKNTNEFSKEKYSGARYKLASVTCGENFDLNNLKIPNPNRFITNEFELQTETSYETKKPKKILKMGHGELWFLGNEKFKLPIGKICFDFQHSSAASSDVNINQATIHLYNKLLVPMINKRCYDADNAGLKSTIGGGFAPNGNNFQLDNTLSIILEGLNQKLGLLLDEILSVIKNFNLKKGVFEEFKKVLLEDYHNYLLQPKVLAADLASQLCLDSVKSIFDNIEDLKSLNFDQFLQNVANIWKNSYVTCLIEGNFHKDHAIEMFESVTKKLQIKKNLQKLNSVPKIKITRQPLCLKVENLNKADGNR